MGEIAELLTAALHGKQRLARLVESWRKRWRDHRRGFGDGDIASLTAKIEEQFADGAVAILNAREERAFAALMQRHPQLMAPQRAPAKRAA